MIVLRVTFQREAEGVRMRYPADYVRLIALRRGDITEETVDAIVNAANPTLLGGGGVDGAIHRAAGPELLAECRTLGGCAHGEARITGAYQLPARYVIHTPGPVYRGGAAGERDVLTASYRNCMRLAHEHGLQSIAFPSISTGVYGYPPAEAAEVALNAVLEYMTERSYRPEVRFVLFDERTEAAYRTAWERLRRESEITS